MRLILDSLSKKNSIYLHFILVIIFSFLYWICGKIETYYKMNITDINGKKTEEKVEAMNLYHAFYFSLITQTTVGYGHHPAPTIISRSVNILQLICILLLYLF